MYKIPATTLLLGKNLVYVPECHSTNDLALELSQLPSTPAGTLVITNDQTSGRGQRGNSWEAASGLNFTLSLILKPSFLFIKDQFYLNIFTSLAVRDYLVGKTKALVQIKWPNDVLVDGKKICGILVENQIQGSSFSNSIVGIGLNINQKLFEVETATSLSLVAGYEFVLEDELEGLLKSVEARYLQLQQLQLSDLLNDYLQSLYRLNELRTFESGDLEFTGTIKGIDEAGRIAIDTVEGLRYFNVKEVKHVK